MNNNKWLQYYSGIFEKKVQIKKVVEAQADRDRAKDRRDRVKQELSEMDQKIKSLELEEDQALNKNEDSSEKIKANVDRARKLQDEIRSLSMVLEKIKDKLPDIEKSLKIEEERFGVIFRGVLKNVREEEQESLNKDLNDILNRILAYTEASYAITKKFRAQIPYYHLGTRSDLSISQLLKDLKI